MNAYAGVGGFSGLYAPENWNFVSEGDGLVDESNAPDSIELTSSDGGCFTFGFSVFAFNVCETLHPSLKQDMDYLDL